MSTTAIIILGIVAVAVLLIAMYFAYNNKEIALRKEAEAQRGNIAVVRDRMFKILMEQANVSKEYREAFEEIYPKIIAGRYARGGGLMKWIQEANPNFDTSLYQKVQNSIEVQRTSFSQAQTRMLDIIKQRETLIEQLPSCWFVKNKSVILYTPITSTDTASVVASGVDDFVLSFN